MDEAGSNPPSSTPPRLRRGSPGSRGRGTPARAGAARSARLPETPPVMLSLTVPSSPSAPAVPAPIRTVVLPTDFSPAAERALPVALALAERCGAEVHLTHTLHAIPGDVATWREQQARARLDATRMLYRYALPGRGEAALRPVVLTPMPVGEAVVAYARYGRADLVVMAAHGWKAPCEATVSDRTAHVLRSAPCPVLLVPPEDAPAPPFRRIAAFGPDPAVADLAARVAGLLGAVVEPRPLDGLDPSTPLPTGPPDLWVVPDAAAACVAFARVANRAEGRRAAVFIPAATPVWGGDGAA